MRTKKDTAIIVNRLKSQYPVSECSLSYDKAWQLMVAVRLSAQCTDKRVNVVTEELFARYPSPQALIDAGADNIEAIVKPCGLGKSKARDIYGAMCMLTQELGGKVPEDMDTLLAIPGVGRKSANLIRGDIFKLPAIVADTHCIRIANCLGFIASTDPFKVELALAKVIDPAESSDFCHRCVMHGRAVCTARRAECQICVLADICRFGIKNINIGENE